MAAGPESVERHRFVPSRKASLWMGLNPGRLSVSQGFPLSGSALPVPLALGVNSGTGKAGDTLFDADHRVRPHQTRLQSGGIADPTLSRDFDEEDEVHAAWTAAHPGHRRLGANACRASLAAILDDNDGDPVGQGPVPGHPQGRLRPGRTGTPVPVQPVVVMETADGSWPISDILEPTRHRSLTEPAPKGTRGTGGHAPRPRGRQPGRRPGTGQPLPDHGKGRLFGGTALAVGDVFAAPPDRHRDRPNDLLARGRAEGAAGRHRPGSRHRLPRLPAGIDGGPDQPRVHRVHRPQVGRTGPGRLATAPTRCWDGHPQRVAVRLSGASASGPAPTPLRTLRRRLPNGIRGTGARRGATGSRQSPPRPRINDPEQSPRKYSV